MGRGTEGTLERGSEQRPEETTFDVEPETEAQAGRVVVEAGELAFLNVRGSAEEMGHQLGRRTAASIHAGPLIFFDRYLDRVLQESPLRRARGAVDAATHALVARRLERNIPRRTREAMAALAEGADVVPERLLRASLMPESFLWLVGTYHRLMSTGRAYGLPRPPLCGCTSAVIRPPAASRLLHGRNFDYMGATYWDRHAQVVFYHPDDGLDYVSVSSAGVWGGGITAMNAAGLSMAVHQHFVDRFDLDNGVPIGCAGDEIMRRAHDLDEALVILRQFPPAAGWTYVLTQAHGDQAAVVEVAPGREHVWRLPPGQRALGRANLYWGEDFEQVEVDFHPEYYRCNHARQRRVVTLLDALVGRERAGGPPAQAIDVARILGDLHDPITDTDRLFGPTIANVNTVGSVVFDPQALRLWVGVGPSPVSRGPFVPFCLRDPQNPHRGAPQPHACALDPYPGWRDTSAGESFGLYRTACARFLDGARPDGLLVLLEHALALQPDEPHLHVLVGLLALRIGRARRTEVCPAARPRVDPPPPAPRRGRPLFGLLSGRSGSAPCRPRPLRPDRLRRPRRRPRAHPRQERPQAQAHGRQGRQAPHRHVVRRRRVVASLPPLLDPPPMPH